MDSDLAWVNGKSASQADAMRYTPALYNIGSRLPFTLLYFCSFIFIQLLFLVICLFLYLFRHLFIYLLFFIYFFCLFIYFLLSISV